MLFIRNGSGEYQNMSYLYTTLFFSLYTTLAKYKGRYCIQCILFVSQSNRSNKFIRYLHLKANSIFTSFPTKSSTKPLTYCHQKTEMIFQICFKYVVILLPEQNDNSCQFFL